MKHFLKRSLALICMLALLVGITPLSLTASAAEVGEFTVLSTTDMHGRCWDTNVLNDVKTTNSMLNVATAVAGIRAEKENVILLDNGDTYQGTPVSSYQLSLQKQGKTDLPNPMALSLKEIDYDAATVGNHEFNYAWDLMNDVRAYLADGTQGNAVTSLCANLYYDGTDGVHTKGENVFTPYMFKTFTVGGKDYKIAIIGFENTDCPRWDVPDNYPGIVFTHPDNTTGSIAWEAEKYIAKVKAEGADFIIVAYHSGLGDGAAPEDIEFGKNSENQVLSMIKNTEGIGMVVAGHDHSSGYSGKKYEDKAGNEVIVVNGGGNNLTSTTFAINDDGTITLKAHEDLALKNYAADAKLKEKIQPYVTLASDYVNQVFGTIKEGDWSTSTKFYLEQTDTIDLINRAQISRGSVYMAAKYDTEEKVAALYKKTGLDHLTVDCSSTSVVVSGNYTVQPGKMSMKDIYRLYKYDNTLYLIPMTGAQIKEALEFNAATHFTVNTSSGTPVFSTMGEDFTNPVFYGLDFEYDMSKEAYSRITNLKFADGREVDPAKTYIMAVNNYHLGNTSGPFADYTTTDAVWSQTDDLGGGVVQDLIAEFVADETAKNGGVSPAPSHWKLVYTGEITTGEATGKYIGDLVADPSKLADGDTVMIHYPAGNSLVSNVASGTKLAPAADLTTGKDQIGTNNASTLFTVKKDGEYFLFVDADGKYMTSGAEGNALSMTDEKSEYSLWFFEATEGGFHIRSVNAAHNGNKNQALEYYGGFTTYGLKTGDSAYIYNLYSLPTTSCAHKNTEVRGKVDATCTKDGYTGDTYCTDCGEKLAEGKTVPALGHKLTATAEKAATCTEKGNLAYWYCSVCEKYFSDKEGKTEITLSDTVLEALGHKWSEWFVGIAPTCCEEGLALRLCDRCGLIEQKLLDKADECLFDSYDDLDPTQWYHCEVEFAIANELMFGVGTRKFDPEGNLTRAMLVTVLYRFEGSPSVEGLENPFKDVPAGEWYTDAVIWAASNGIVNGTDIGVFSPEENITREQVATIFHRYNEAPEGTGNLSAFPDADKVDGYAVEAMKWAVGEGIINGSDGLLDPLGNATRAQIAAIFYRYIMG